MEDNEISAQFEEMGETYVRAMAPQWSGKLRGDAYRWLQQKAREDRRRNEAFQVAQAAAARDTKRAANITIALVVVSILIAVLAWLFPREPDQPSPVNQPVVRPPLASTSSNGR